MATFRIIAVMLAVAGSVVLAHAQGCDSPYPWLCKPVPSIDPPETAEPSKQPAGKPLPIAARDAGMKRSAKTAQAQRPEGRFPSLGVARAPCQGGGGACGRGNGRGEIEQIAPRLIGRDGACRETFG